LRGLGVNADSVMHTASTFAHLTGFLYGARRGPPLTAWSIGVGQGVAVKLETA
jgi:hypothetical protein